MGLEQIPFCNFCGEAIFPDEGTPVRIKKDGHVHQFYFHNTIQKPCLRKEIDLLRLRFTAPINN
jgi:ribosomal protein L24E